MSQLEVATPNLTRDVYEHVFVFNSGLEQSFVIDPEAGDTIDDRNADYVITLVDKPDMLDSEKIVPGETIRIHKATLAIELVRKRVKRLPTPEEMFELGKLMHREVKTVQ